MYENIFAGKDIARSEAAAACFHESFKHDKPTSFIEPEYDQVGELNMFIPSFRTKVVVELKQAKQEGELPDINVEEFNSFFPTLEDGMLTLLKLVLPLNPSLEMLEESEGIKQAQARAQRQVFKGP